MGAFVMNARWVVVGLVVLLVCVGVVGASEEHNPPPPSTEGLISTDPSSPEEEDYSDQYNYAKIEVYGYQIDPTVDDDPNYDYYIFFIWGVADPTGDWSVDSSGADDPAGPTMQVEFYAWD
ncbi:MAG: hypothetical protein ACXQTS_02115, partial [Candidatus Methanospirareceae archaeon]